MLTLKNTCHHASVRTDTNTHQKGGGRDIYNYKTMLTLKNICHDGSVRTDTTSHQRGEGAFYIYSNYMTDLENIDPEKYMTPRRY